RGLVLAHGGTIEAQSRGPGRGATFIVDLPTAAVAATAPQVATISPPSIPEKLSPRFNSGKLPILVVEDHVDSARMLERLLRSAGYAPQVAENVVDAIRTGRQQRFGLLLSDITLPDGTGL